MASTSIYVRDYRKEVPGGLTHDRKTWQFPIIESLNSHGRKTMWKIYVRLFRMGEFTLPNVPEDAFVQIDDSFFDSKPMDQLLYGWINVDSGIEGGKVKKSTPTIIRAGKNLGKASATNVFTQALRDAYGIHNKQLKKSVATAKAGVTTELFPPMLAQILKDQKTPPKVDETHPLYVQRKYNGVRTVITLDQSEVEGGEKSFRVIAYSRRKNLYPGFQYIKDELLDVLKFYWEEGRNLYLDGEIYKHGAALQDISGYSRREDEVGDIKYNYMIYDCFVANEPNLSYTQRKKIVDDIFSEFKFEHAQKVETFEVYDMDEVQTLYKSFLEEEYEGAMVRVDEPYRYSYNEYHSKNLLKIKPTYDHEFLVTGFTTGEKGKAAEALMIICQTEEGKQFPCTPAMEIPDRIALAKKMVEVEPNGRTHFANHWEGKKIIVTFDEWSRDKVPQRARTRLQIRTWD